MMHGRLYEEYKHGLQGNTVLNTWRTIVTDVHVTELDREFDN